MVNIWGFCWSVLEGQLKTVPNLKVYIKWRFVAFTADFEI